MKRALVAFGFFVGAVLVLAGVSGGHGGNYGGTYRGPGDLVPQTGPGGPGPTTPTDPTAPGPSTPTGPAGPGPNLPVPAGATGLGSAGGGPRTSAGLDLGPSLAKWQYWWEFNREPFLDLKAKIHGPSVVTGSDDFFLGRVDRSAARDSLRPTPETIRRVIVPALLEALQKERNREILDSSMIALAKIGGDDAFVDAIAAYLPDRNQTLVEAAAVSLGILARPKALPILRDLALDAPEGRKLVGRSEVPFRVRAFATYGLGLLAYAAPETRKEVASILLEALESGRTAWQDVRIAAVISMGLFADPEGRTVPALERVLDDAEAKETLRAHVPVSLAKILRASPGDARARVVERLVRSMRGSEEKERVRESCVIALGLLTTPADGHAEDALRALGDVISSGREQERNFAAISLARIGGPEAVRMLRRGLARGKNLIRPWSGLALGVLCHTARKEGTLIPDRAGILEELRVALREESNPEYVAAYALALGLAGDTGALEEMARRLERIGDEEARGYLCVAMGLLESPEARELLHREVQGALRKPALLERAAIGLGLLSDREAVPELLRILAESKTLAVQAAVATALGYIGDERSVEPLVAMLKNEELTDFARGFAAVALGIVADKEPLPWNSKIAVSVNYRALVPTLLGTALSSGILDIL
jgi:HEAT repeat protein